jgi:hypothetical protein
LTVRSARLARWAIVEIEGHARPVLSACFARMMETIFAGDDAMGVYIAQSMRSSGFVGKLG